MESRSILHRFWYDMADSEPDDKVSIREFYSLLDGRLSSINLSIGRLESKFDTLEAGRLSRLEKDFADFRGEYKGRISTNAFIIPTIITVIGIVINLILRSRL